MSMHGEDRIRPGGGPDAGPGSRSVVGPGFSRAIPPDVGPGSGSRLAPGSSRADDDVASDFGRADDPINIAARDLTMGEPSAQLHHRVRSRIARPGGVSRPTWIGVAGAAAAVLALFIFSDRPQIPPDQRSAVAVPQAPPAGQQDSAEPPPTQVVVPVAAKAPPVGQPRTRRPTRSLEPIEPLVIEPMTLPLIAIGTSSGVMPIEMDDLHIEPLQIE